MYNDVVKTLRENNGKCRDRKRENEMMDRLYKINPDKEQ